MSLAFNPEMLVAARESRRLTQAQFARLMKVQQGTVSKVESGTIPPSGDFIDRATIVLRYPAPFFSQTERVYGFGSSIFYHRKRQNLSIATLRQLHAQLNIRRNQIKALLRATELDTLCQFRPIDLADYNGRVEEVANVLRGAWRIPIGPIRHLTQSIEDAGGIVIPHDFDTTKVDAISEWTELCPPLFFVNANSAITGDRLRFSLAHEIGHVVMHRFPAAEMENEADRFAAEFLMPAAEIRSSLRKLDLPKLAALKREWRVSMAALIERAYQLKTVTEWQRRSLIVQLRGITHGAREPLDTDIEIERPKLLDELVNAHVETLGYTANELSQMLCVFEDECEALYLPKKPKILELRRA